MAEPNPIVVENLRPGTRAWQLERPATRREIEGYGSATSVDRAGVIALYVNTASPSFDVEIFRMGWYQGLGARRVWAQSLLPGTAQRMPTMDPATGLVDCQWINPVSITAENPDDRTDWPSGIYLAKLTESVARAQSYILFVGRDDLGHAGLLFQLSVTTYQAYNPWGGKSLYHWGSSDHKRASKVSFNRPFAANPQNPAAAFGVGAGEFLTNLQPHPATYPVSNAGWDFNMVRWLERQGFDLSYCTNLDTHSSPALLRRHKAWLSVGHDEYWTREMRQHVEAARDGGVHLGFFTANCAYWQIRLEPSAATGTADRVMVCFKKAARDPWVAGGGDPSRATDKWRSESVNRPEDQLIGVMYAGDPVDANIVIKLPGHWVFANTGLVAVAELPGLLGYEVDAVHGRPPDALEILAESPWTALNDPGRSGVAHMTVYAAASGAMVVATGSIQWSWGLDDFNAPGLRSSRLNPAAQQITRNVLMRFLAAPR